MRYTSSMWKGPATAVCVVLAASHALGQPSLLSANEALNNINKQFEAVLPACPDIDQLRKSVREDTAWLVGRFRDTNVDRQYVASLLDLSDAVHQATKKENARSACSALRLVRADLHVKRLDCRAVGHSRTDIPVEINTVEGKKEIPGWEVYARWLPAGDRFSPIPKRLKDLSSPARGTVPIPGEYEVFAKQSSGVLTTDPVRVSIGGSKVFTWSLSVPAASVPPPRDTQGKN